MKERKEMGTGYCEELKEERRTYTEELEETKRRWKRHSLLRGAGRVIQDITGSYKGNLLE